MISYFILGMTFAFAAAIQPGPLQSYFISQSLIKGWQRTLPAAFAPIISDGPIIVLVVVLLSQAPVWLINVMQCSGGLLLLFLAAGAVKTWKNYDSQESESESSRRTIIQATVVNFLNPAPYLGWSLIMGPLLMKGWQESPINGIALLIGFYVTLIMTNMGIIVAFAYARKFGFRLTKTLIGLSAIALGCFGIYQLWSGVSYFLPNG